MTTPKEIYDYDMATRTRILRKRQEIPSGHDPADYVTRRILRRRRMAPSAGLDPASPRYGARRHGAAAAVWLWLLWHGDAGRRSPPTGCRWSIAASSTPSPISAAAPTRAGAGISTASARRRPTASTISRRRARALIAARYTGAKRIVGHGGSAGGMLMGAVANRRRELFAGIIADVPFVDVLNTMLDDTLPLTPPEWPEWGNPIASADGFRDHPVLFALRQCRARSIIRRSWRWAA